MYIYFGGMLGLEEIGGADGDCVKIEEEGVSWVT